MAKILSKEKARQIKETVYLKADEHGYISKGRNENGDFMTGLVDDPEVGEVLSEYIDKGKIRTYIKDSIMNGYAKSRKRAILKDNSPIETVKVLFSKNVSIIQTIGETTLCNSECGDVFVVSSGNYVKWETALRKALELVAREPKFVFNGKTPNICLQLAVLTSGVTDGDKKLIIDALSAINVKVRFCSIKGANG